MRTLLSFLPRLWTNWITLLGAIITTFSALTLLLLTTVGIAAANSNMYASAFFFVALPGLFMLGLLIIPVGFIVERLRGADHVKDPFEAAFTAALQDKNVRRRALFVAGATLINVVILGLAGEKSVHYLDSPNFCGTTCHTVMQPEWVTYNDSPHARVACVECHIGPGIAWEVKAKIDGLRQVVGVVTDSHEKPIPSPANHMRSTADTCERCHWTDKNAGNKARVYPHYKDDQANSPSFNAMLLYVGGRNPKSGAYEGIHSHTTPNREIRYEMLDMDRKKLGKLEVIENGKTIAVYERPGTTAALAVRTMDCIDCHNRPTHQFALSPRLAVDRALYTRQLDPAMPFISKIAAEVLSRTDIKRDDAESELKKDLVAAYQKEAELEEKPSEEALAAAAKTLADIYNRNIFPEMNVAWGTYRGHIDHNDEKDEVGCFRCHNSDYESKLDNGRAGRLDQDCEACHATLASEEDPANFDDTLKALLPKAE